MICNKCRQDNPKYNNYCLNDGENLDTLPIKSALGGNLKKYCSKCGENIKDNENYCFNCGEMIEVVISKNESFVNDLGSMLESQKNSKSKLTNINFQNFKNIDKKGILLSVALTLILCSIVITINNMLLYSNNELNSQMQYYYGYITPSKFKLFMFNLAAMNVPSIKLALKISLINAFNLSVAGRTIIYPLIIGLSMYVSVRLGLKRDDSENKALENSISCAALYSIIMVIIGFIGSYNLYVEEATSLMISMNTFNLFLNSFIISFIGAYIGISNSKEDDMIVGFIKKSLINILIGIGIISVILAVLTKIEIDKNTYLSEVISYYSFGDNIILVVIAIVVLITLSSWLFTLSNFVAISAFGLTSYNIISLTKEMNFPIILLSIIPIAMLVLAGRKIKSTYGENQIKAVGIYSGTYAVSMLVLSYFSRITLSLNYGDVEEYLYDFIYSIVSEFGYEYATIINNYLEKIYNSLSSGVYMGSNLFLTILITFIFSFIFIFLGYKSKKIDSI